MPGEPGNQLHLLPAVRYLHVHNVHRCQFRPQPSLHPHQGGRARPQSKMKEEINQLQRLEQETKDRVTEFTEKKEAFRAVLSKEESRVMGSLEEKLGHLNNSLQSVQKDLYIRDTLINAKGENVIQDQAFIMEYSEVPQLGLKSCLEQLEAQEEVNEAQMKFLRAWTEKRLATVVIPDLDRDLHAALYGTVPILDANTAHPKLRLSDNNRKVAYNVVAQSFDDQDTRFNTSPQVLANQGFEGGRWYWEVYVPEDEGTWKVGLCKSHMDRKGPGSTSSLGYNASSWCLEFHGGKLNAVHNQIENPVTVESLEQVGVFLDYDGGTLTFFNVTPGKCLAPIYYYKHSFSGRLYPALSVSKTHLVIRDIFES
ncbi:nuclear factor 7, brain-like isoform X2 [Syngnathoides biaculeatus]|uniref:nuclear factor 7, brain-like isoform X2 n=1 Tax=Syngnathoides biaculeatus TaxID=300417 RepID=UPI002ADE52D4|nr:nuclear factor 7, brain-like isoform X2 [Syngnathoides biaculeatus]